MAYNLQAQMVANRLEEFADAAYETYDTWLCKLDAIVKDMAVMGSKYGAAVVEAMKKDYGRYKEAFTLNSVHLGHAVSTLNSLLRDSQLYPPECTCLLSSTPLHSSSFPCAPPRVNRC